MFASAYQNGTGGHARLGDVCDFAEVEWELRGEYLAGGNELPWSLARLASEAAWDRRNALKSTPPGSVFLSNRFGSGAISDSESSNSEC